jgi:hypothetical protein
MIAGMRRPAEQEEKGKKDPGAGDAWLEVGGTVWCRRVGWASEPPDPELLPVM